MIERYLSLAAAALMAAAVTWVVACGEADKSAPDANTSASSAAVSPSSPAEQNPSTQASAADDAPSEEGIRQVLAPWNGDLDGMVERRYVRMLVTFSKTNYFLDKAEQRGLTYDAGKLLEAFLNQRLKTRTIHVHVVFVPVRIDRMFRELAEAHGDIAAAGLTITPERQKLVDFARPFITNVREIGVTAADQPRSREHRIFRAVRSMCVARARTSRA